MAADARTRRGGDGAVLVVGIALLAVLGWEVAQRVSYRCDLLLWSESPMMTNLMKLAAGEPIYGEPWDLNSFIYSPGVEWLAWLLLRPFGLALDVRACRMLVVVFGLGAAACTAATATAVGRALAPEASRARLFGGAFCAAVLIVFRNLTADTVHPDNLHMLHATATLWLVVRALDRPTLSATLLAAAVAGLGVLCKQTAALAPVGAAVALLLGRPRSGGERLAILSTAAGVMVIAVATLLGPQWSRFYLFDLPSSQNVYLSKIPRLLHEWLSGVSLLLIVVLPAAIADVRRRGGARGRSILLAWSCMALAEVLPSTLAFLKEMGAGNNLGIMTLWLVPVVWPYLTIGTASPVAGIPSMGDRLRRPLALAVLVLAFPVRLPPSPEAHAACARLIDDVGRDLAAGKAVLINNGTAPLIASGDRRVPRFQSILRSELFVSGRHEYLERAETALAATHYDRVYQLGGNSPKGLTRYHTVDTIPCPAPLVRFEQWMNQETWIRPPYATRMNILEPDSPPPSNLP